MIHGKAVTIGCVPVGDDAIEDIFYLASAVGIKNVSVVIAPYDMRSGRNPELEKSTLAWYSDLCGEIFSALSEARPGKGIKVGTKEEKCLSPIHRLDAIE